MLPFCVMAKTPEFYTDLSGENLLNNLAYRFLAGASVYATPLYQAASRLFWLLLGISIVSIGINVILKNDDLPSFLAIFVKLCINTGIFLFLLNNGSAIGVSIIDSFTSLTNTEKVGPSELLDLAYNTFKVLVKATQNQDTSFIVSILMYLSAYIYIILMFLIVINYTVTYVSAYILCILGMFCLGFGAFNFTRNIAIGVLSQIFYFALKLMTIIMICNTGSDVLTEMSQIIEKSQSIGIAQFNTLIFTSTFIFILCQKIPHLIGSLVLNAKSTDSSFLTDAFALGSLGKKILK